jgi:2-dehydro-3-deoxygluconokinase
MDRVRGAGLIPVKKTTEFKVHVSGAEFNTSANLSDCFGLKTAICSAMVKYPIGEHQNFQECGRL